jgi:hypothetical protein
MSHQEKTKEWQPIQNWFRPQNLSSNQTETRGEQSNREEWGGGGGLSKAIKRRQGGAIK